MNYQEFSLTVDKAKDKNPIWFGLESDPPATDSEIEEVEKQLSIILPEEYKRFVKEFGGGYFAFTKVFSVNKESEWYIINQNKQVSLIESHNFLAVSDNQVGDFYGFKVINGKCESYLLLFDHETGQLENSKYVNLFDYLVKVGLRSN
jgi:hypothetical protein